MSMNPATHRRRSTHTITTTTTPQPTTREEKKKKSNQVGAFGSVDRRQGSAACRWHGSTKWRWAGSDEAERIDEGEKKKMRRKNEESREAGERKRK